MQSSAQALARAELQEKARFLRAATRFSPEKGPYFYYYLRPETQSCIIDTCRPFIFVIEEVGNSEALAEPGTLLYSTLETLQLMPRPNRVASNWLIKGFPE